LRLLSAISRKKNRIPGTWGRRIILLLLLSGLFLLSALAYLLPVSFIRGDQIFRGYYTVLVDASIPLSDAVRLAEESGFSEIISSSTARIDYYDFGELSSILLAELDKRFDELDPRVDPYMRSVKNLFFTSCGGRDWNILFVAGSFSPFQVYSRLLKAFRNERAVFQVVEYDGLKQILFCLFFCLFAGFIICTFRAPKIYLLLGIIPWLTFPLSGSFSLLVSASIMYLGFSLCIEEWGPVFTYYLNYGIFDPQKGRVLEACAVWIASGIVSAVLLTTSGQGLLGFIPVLIAFLGDLALFGCEILRLSARKGRQEHTLFFPVTILKVKGNSDPRRVVRASVIAALLLLSPLLVLFFDKGDIPIPAPIDVPQVHSFTRSEMETLWNYGSAGDLPNISSYIAHRAYQEGLLFKGTYGFPEEDEELSIPSFRIEGELVRMETVAGIQFTDSWYRGIMRENLHDSIGALLREQKKPYYIQMRPLKTVTGSRFSMVRFFVLCLFVFIPMVPWCRSESSPFILGIRSVLIRRKQQTA
jgi:hypothetical protein